MKLTLNSSLTFELVVTNPLADPIYVNTATVTVEIPDVLPATIMPYIAATNGVYRVTVPPIAGLIDCDRYDVIYNVSASGLTAQTNCKVRATVEC